MMRWQTEHTGQNFGDIIRDAGCKGPQVVVRDKAPIAVVLSPDDYRRLVRQGDANFAALLAQCPFGPDDVDPMGMSLSGAT